MKKRKDIRIRINVDFLSEWVEVIYTEDVSRYRNTTLLKYRPELGTFEEACGALHSYLHNVTGSHIILHHDAPLSTVAHEVSHFIDKIIREAGIDDTETRAYLMGYVMGQLYE